MKVADERLQRRLRAGEEVALMDFKEHHSEINCQRGKCMKRPRFYDVCRCTAMHITKNCDHGASTHGERCGVSLPVQLRICNWAFEI